MTHRPFSGGPRPALLEATRSMTKPTASLGDPTARGGGWRFTIRPIITGRRGVVAAGYYLSAEAAMPVLRQGGSAIDAVVAMGFCCDVLEPHLVGVAGESPILIYHAGSGRVAAINGQGPAGASPRKETACAIGW